MDQTEKQAGVPEPENQEERKQWHPVLVDGLRYLLPGVFHIDPEHGLAALPTRVDAMLMRQVQGRALPFPYNHLGAVTLMELVSPGEWVTWREVSKLCVDGLLHRLSEDIEDTAHVSLWLVASRMSAAFLDGLTEELGPVEQIAPGLWQTRHMRSPLVVVHLHDLPLTVETLPFLMVYRGPREREIAAFVLEHGFEQPFFVEQTAFFHRKVLEEVLAMKGMSIEAYRDIADLQGVILYYGKRNLIDEIGEEEFIRGIGEERLFRDLVQRLGADRVRELIAQAERRDGGSESEPHH